MNRRPRLASLALAGLLLGVTAVSAVSAAPLAKRQPIALRTWAQIGSGWWMRVNSTRPMVSPRVAGYGDEPAGSGIYVVGISLRFVAHGKANILGVFHRTEVVGIHKIYYANASACLGTWKKTYGYLQLSRGQTSSGEICFEDRANDAATMRLLLRPDWDGSGSFPSPIARFALR